MKCCCSLWLFSLVHVHSASLLLQQNKITIRYFGDCLRTQRTGKMDSHEAACTCVGDSQTEETLKVVRIAASWRNLTSCYKTLSAKLWVRDKVLGSHTDLRVRTWVYSLWCQQLQFQQFPLNADQRQLHSGFQPGSSIKNKIARRLLLEKYISMNSVNSSH